MTKTIKRIFFGFLAAVGLLVGAIAISAPASAVSTSTQFVSGNSIPRCINDDYNDGTQQFCFTQRVDDRQVIVIDRTDTISANMSGRESLNNCDFFGYVGEWCKTAVPKSQSTSGYLVQSPGGNKYYAK